MTWRISPTGGGCTALELERDSFSVWITDFDGSSAASGASEEVNVCFFLNSENATMRSIPELKKLSEYETPGISIGDEQYWSYRIKLAEISLEKLKHILSEIPKDTFNNKVVLGLNTPEGDETR
jgi:hypothetical protein